MKELMESGLGVGSLALGCCQGCFVEIRVVV